MSNNKPFVWAHRGASGYLPENTLMAFQEAVDMGADGIELDVQLTKDDEIVVIHDEWIDRTSNGKGWVKDYTLEELRGFNYNKTKPEVEHADIPTMREVFELIKPTNLVINIELKTGVVFYKELEEKIMALTKEYGMEDRVLLQSFDWQTLVEMKKINPKIRLVALWQEQPSWGPDAVSLRAYEEGKSPWLGGLDIDDYKGKPILAAHAIGVNVVSPYYPEVSKQDVEQAHELGMKVVPWTVNEVNDMNMMINMGVDGIITDKPWILRELLEKRGIFVRQPTVNENSPYHTGTEHIEVETKKMTGGADAAE